MHLAMVTLAGAGLCALWDVRTGRIPNKITFSCMFVGLAINTLCSGFKGLCNACFGIFVGVLLLIIPFVLGGMGAGDVKMLAAIGAINGSKFVLQAFLFGAAAGGVLVLVSRPHASIFSKKKDTIPYGVAIFFGTITAYMMRLGF